MVASTKDKDDAAVREFNAGADDDDFESIEEEAERTGRTIEDIAAERQEEEANKPVPPTQLAIPGTREKIPRSTGGRAPEESEFRLMGGRRPINGSFDKGEHVTLVVESIVRAVEDIDQDDEWGTVSKTIRVHKARQTYVRIATPDLLARRLLDQVSIGEAKALLDELDG
jgi:hypothetical protein